MSCDFKLFREVGENELSTEDLYQRMLHSLDVSIAYSQEMCENEHITPLQHNCEVIAIQGRAKEIEAFKNDRKKLIREIEESFKNDETYYYNVDDYTPGLYYDGEVYINVPKFDDCVYRYRTADEGLPNFPKNIVKSYDDYLNLMKEHSHLKCVKEDELTEFIKNNNIIAFFT